VCVCVCGEGGGRRVTSIDGSIIATVQYSITSI
jgi:hypothetical protein